MQVSTVHLTDETNLSTTLMGRKKYGENMEQLMIQSLPWASMDTSGTGTLLFIDRSTRMNSEKKKWNYKGGNPGDVQEFKTSGCHLQQSVFKQILEINILF